MKILFVTDLHGSAGKYGMLLHAARHHGADAVINGGDMLPGGDLFEGQREFITGCLSRHFLEFEREGIDYLCLLGNDDLRVHDAMFEETCSRYPHIWNIAHRKADVRGYEFIGMNMVADYPFRLKDRCRRDTAEHLFQRQTERAMLSTPDGALEIEDWHGYASGLSTLRDELESLPAPGVPDKTVYAIHMPPYGIGLDRLGNGEEAGSLSVYEFIGQRGPLLTLHGHIHESPEVSGRWYGRIGRTLCIQPGQLGDSLVYVLIDLKTMEAERFIKKVSEA